MTLGLIAGNGRFPFLVLDAARSLGHAITIVAVKEEASPELEPRRRPRRASRCTGCRSATSDAASTSSAPPA